MRFAAVLIPLTLLAGVAGAQPTLDQAPAVEGEWGYRPAGRSEVNPPGFVWRPTKGAVSYDFECAGKADFSGVVVRAVELHYACYCPERPLAAGNYFWRYRAADKAGKRSDWSEVRRFSVDAQSVEFPMPPRKELVGRIPASHPRLLVRPEELEGLRARSKTDLKSQYAALIKQADGIVKNPPPTAEPPKYPEGVAAKSEEWRKIWWGNRLYTIKVLDGAATLAFARLMTDDPARREAYGQLSRRLLMDAAAWDPKGSTNYRYNDEAGMPYIYYFARAYTFLGDALPAEDKAKCRAVIRERGNDIYTHLNPKQLWSPYASHSNRAWHKLAEAGIAFVGEIPEAEEWVWFAMNVFWNVYPVWSDEEGGWHEGISYWNSYIERFTFFADSMRSALGVDAFRKPYFSRAGYFPMYVQPPGTAGAGFGDLNPDRPAKANVQLMTALAAQAKNPQWQWYVEALGGPEPEPGYIGLIRGALPKVQSKPPTDWPASRVFRGIGQAYLNTTLASAAENVEIGFKSSPFGTQSHGYDANNSFFLYAYGQRLLAPSGRRDVYGSEHHAKWMWETKSTNSVLINGKGQTPKHSAAADAKIAAFYTSPDFDYVAGDASQAYGPGVRRFVRHVFFFKPDLVVLYDDIETADAGATVDLLLHSPVEIKAKDARDILIDARGAYARAQIVYPAEVKVSVTDQYETPPRDRIKVKEWHLSAQTKSAGMRTELVTAIRVGRGPAANDPGPIAKIEPGSPGAWTLKAMSGGKAVQIGTSAKAGGAAVLTVQLMGSERSVIEIRGEEVTRRK